MCYNKLLRYHRRWQQIGEADRVGIRDDTVSKIGSGIADLAGLVTEIDLQDNLLWEWKEVCSGRCSLDLAYLTLLIAGPIVTLVNDLNDEC